WTEQVGVRAIPLGACEFRCPRKSGQDGGGTETRVHHYPRSSSASASFSAAASCAFASKSRLSRAKSSPSATRVRQLFSIARLASKYVWAFPHSCARSHSTP